MWWGRESREGPISRQGLTGNDVLVPQGDVSRDNFLGTLFFAWSVYQTQCCINVCLQMHFCPRALAFGFPGLLNKVFSDLLSPLGIRSENNSRITKSTKVLSARAWSSVDPRNSFKKWMPDSGGACLQSQHWEAETSESLSLRLAWSSRTVMPTQKTKEHGKIMKPTWDK